MAEFHEILGFEVLATLGFGARSTIYAVRDKNSTVFALKRVVKSTASDQRYIDQALSEHEVASKFDHPLLRRSLKVFKQRKFIRTSEVYVLMEMVDGVTLEQYHPADFSALLDVCRQVAQGLGAMHAQSMVHADMKPNNVLVTDQQRIKIIDFGQSCPSGAIKERIQGTPDYIAPEQVLRRTIIPQTDVFNLGATMYWLLTKRHVPTLIPKGQAGLRLQTEDRCPQPMELNDTVPLALNSLVMDCIETEPAQRPKTMSQVIDRLDIASNQITRQNGTGPASVDVPLHDDDLEGLDEPDLAPPRRNAS